ncbi:TPA: excalibur calcium-binding domain-containing protein [Bacillus cereus]|uniref:excalibur calcium-binding domain-containing protein n=1 Tax=Bacillus TaxID=1386 RepID=UPI0005A30D32|nr:MULTISPECIES: excalibur calcium-binding domain-containing protein [Bacillus cereus group]AJG59976.1 excalibur calcium-binding domain protein [Bacillus cereus D17]MBL3764865.1 excalibur calcium-binding domain-containing protein [Bacillus cereus]MBL3770658.1 excalibur calcium-binding domain-containing protein [Bacillus cereus]MBL3777116.1 excalibur calcium-binding domain-containing protein [Bacillus cereus]MBL3787951.1 excalibur calcium-binding domain-containing protein [Bacillus cereus]
MAILSNIGTALFLIAFILLILCIISFFKKNEKAKQYGRPAVILFMISIVLIITSAETANNPIVEFFSILSFVLFVFFLILAILSVIKKTGVAKKQFIITAILFVIFGALSSISNPTSEKTKATSKQVISNNAEQKNNEKTKELEKKEADEKTQKQEDEKRQAEEQTRKQENEKRQAEEQTRKQEDEKRQAEEQARKQQEEQKRLVDEQARKQQEEQKRLADEQARKQQEEQKRQADEQARKQQEEQKKVQQTQIQPASGNTSNAYYKNCDAVRAAGKAPLYKDQPGYSRKLDKDGDGVACEK